MRYGFIIDNRKCIGCHACTTACKSEHLVPIGVNRTWVKQVEKGVFPNTRRLFSVMRCNHCADAPCVEICPVEALYIRDDGIVDFDKRRCIGCKSCMQACPYDALYIDPESHTAAKCNYCAHRVDIGLEPACVNVCPEHAIISGDMENPESEIAQLLARQAVKVRKPEKGTAPQLYYIDGDDASLNPEATDKENAYFWSSQSRGVGHYAKYAEKLAFSNDDVVAAVFESNGNGKSAKALAEDGPDKSIDVLMGKPHRVYDSPEKGILWGWEVSGYVLTKAIAAGVLIMLSIGLLAGMSLTADLKWTTFGISLLFLALTGALLVKDLDRPDRFTYVLFRPQWRSWLVRGGYIISIYGALLVLWAVTVFLQWPFIEQIVVYTGAVFAILTAVYTAFLFAQAKGRDFWQSPSLALHMLIHAVMAGAAVFYILNMVFPALADWSAILRITGIGSVAVNLAILTAELITTHPTADAKKTVHEILHGRYRTTFWLGTIITGNLIPLILLILFGSAAWSLAAAGILILAGIYFTEKIWVEAPQRIALS